MIFRSFKLFFAALMTALMLLACGNGEPAPAPSGLLVTAGDSSATVSWDMTDGVEYWLFFGPSSLAPSNTASMQGWFGLPGGNVVLKATSPYVVSGLVNGLSYSFSINGRTNGGPGGPGATPVTSTPRIAGSSWSAGSAISGGIDLRGVTYGATTATTTTSSVANFIAAGAGGAIFASLDGVTWNAINYATSSQLNGAAYFGSFKLVGDGGLVLTSTDAATWTARTSGTSQNLYAIASNYLSLNVAVGANGTIITSPDGVTWTAATNSATTRDLYAVTYASYNGGTWVAVGAGGTIVESSDGLTWHDVTSGSTADLRGVAYNTSVSAAGVVTTAFVAVGASGTLLSSANGTNWTAQTLSGAGALNAVSFGTQFVAVGAGGKIFTSTDGLSWTLAPAATGQDLRAVAHGALKYSAVGAAGTNLLSK